MRLLLLADVHANWEALLALQRAEPQPDAVLFAGDAVGYGPDPLNCVRWLAANAVAVRGECDEALLHCGDGLDEAARVTVGLARKQLAPLDAAALTAWPVSRVWEAGGARFLLAHGTPARPIGGTLAAATASEAALAEALAGQAADFVVLGRTHVPALRRSGRTLFINPGSLGQPRHGFPDAIYGVWDDGRVQIKHLHYDHDATARRLRLMQLDSEILDELTGVLTTGLG
jgi:protein phosphatase